MLSSAIFRGNCIVSSSFETVDQWWTEAVLNELATDSDSKEVYFSFDGSREDRNKGLVEYIDNKYLMRDEQIKAVVVRRSEWLTG